MAEMGTLGNFGMLLGGMGQAYGAIQQSKQAKDLLNLQKQGYYDELKRRNQGQMALDTAVSDSTLMNPLKPKTIAPAFPLV